MHALAGVHAAPHALHVPSTGFVHCLYARAAASYMHAFSGVHAGPKCVQLPLPLLVHVKYAAVPA
jgi:hypothetical protein